MRFGIRKKLLLLIVVLSLALIAASSLISSQLYYSSLRRNVLKTCTETAESLADQIRQDHFDFLLKYRSKLGIVYLDNREDIERAAEEGFGTYDDKEKFYSQFTEGIFPPKNALGLSYEMAMFNAEYTSLIEKMDMLAFAGGFDVSSVVFYDREHGNMVYLIDRMPEGSALYFFPASIVKPQDQKITEALNKTDASAFMLNTDCYSFCPVEGTDDVFVLMGKLNTDIIRSVRLFLIYSLGILLGATLMIGLFVLLFADKLIVKNIKKLTDSSERFTSEISGSNPERISAQIRAKDEIGALSDQFDLMQDSILGYISSLEEKTAKEEKLKAELALAASIQSESLPAGGLKLGAITLESFLKPAKEVGGDLYDYFMLDDDSLFFCLADVSGKGIPAALFMMRAMALIKSGITTENDLSSFAYELNNRLCSGNIESVFITAFFGVLDTACGKLRYLRAGHEQPVIRRGGTIIRLGEESNFVLGVFEGVEFTADEIMLLPGDELLLFTDGLNEGINESNEAFGYERIDSTFLSADGEITKTMFESLKNFCGSAEQFDDVTMLAIGFGRNVRLEFDSPGYDVITTATDRLLGELSGFDASSAAEVGLIVDEIMNNQISYAFTDAAAPHIAVSMKLFKDRAILVFEDNGEPFDPLSDAEDIDTSDSDGGFGIRIVRDLSDEQHYERLDGINRLTVEKKLIMH